MITRSPFGSVARTIDSLVASPCAMAVSASKARARMPLIMESHFSRLSCTLANPRPRAKYFGREERVSHHHCVGRGAVWMRLCASADDSDPLRTLRGCGERQGVGC